MRQDWTPQQTADFIRDLPRPAAAAPCARAARPCPARARARRWWTGSGCCRRACAGARTGRCRPPSPRWRCAARAGTPRAAAACARAGAPGSGCLRERARRALPARCWCVRARARRQVCARVCGSQVQLTWWLRLIQCRLCVVRYICYPLQRTIKSAALWPLVQRAQGCHRQPCHRRRCRAARGEAGGRRPGASRLAEALRLPRRSRRRA